MSNVENTPLNVKAQALLKLIRQEMPSCNGMRPSDAGKIADALYLTLQGKEVG